MGLGVPLVQGSYPGREGSAVGKRTMALHQYLEKQAPPAALHLHAGVEVAG